MPRISNTNFCAAKVFDDVCLYVPALINEILGAGTASVCLPEFASIQCPVPHAQQGRALRLIIANASITTEASRRAILKAIARVRTWYEQITSGETSNIAKLAIRHGVTPRFIRIHMKLVLLSPRSIERLMNRPESLPLSLDELLANLPMNWNEQLLGMPSVSQEQKIGDEARRSNPDSFIRTCGS